jgi:hypothetical protein
MYFTDSVGRHEAGDQDGGLRKIQLPAHVIVAVRRDAEMTPFVRVEQGGKDARRVEPRAAEPVRRPVRSDQRPGLQVTDQPMVADIGIAVHVRPLTWSGAGGASWRNRRYPLGVIGASAGDMVSSPRDSRRGKVDADCGDIEQRYRRAACWMAAPGTSTPPQARRFPWCVTRGAWLVVRDQRCYGSPALGTGRHRPGPGRRAPGLRSLAAYRSITVRCWPNATGPGGNCSDDVLTSRRTQMTSRGCPW